MSFKVLIWDIVAGRVTMRAEHCNSASELSALTKACDEVANLAVLAGRRAFPRIAEIEPLH